MDLATLRCTRRVALNPAATSKGGIRHTCKPRWSYSITDGVLVCWLDILPCLGCSSSQRLAGR